MLPSIFSCIPIALAKVCFSLIETSQNFSVLGGTFLTSYKKHTMRLRQYVDKTMFTILFPGIFLGLKIKQTLLRYKTTPEKALVCDVENIKCAWFISQTRRGNLLKLGKLFVQTNHCEGHTATRTPKKLRSMSKTTAV